METVLLQQCVDVQQMVSSCEENWACKWLREKDTAVTNQNDFHKNIIILVFVHHG